MNAIPCPAPAPAQAPGAAANALAAHIAAYCTKRGLALRAVGYHESDGAHVVVKAAQTAGASDARSVMPDHSPAPRSAIIYLRPVPRPDDDGAFAGCIPVRCWGWLRWRPPEDGGFVFTPVAAVDDLDTARTALLTKHDPTLTQS
ncbi:hypothetical protein [Actinomadura gamaensis]|uniref:Uncharacterized protein n=1 Tax=Actinomadura gamaensis TaxID=1763541 RepID=A0ABV9TTC2_9ACTN